MLIPIALTHGLLRHVIQLVVLPKKRATGLIAPALMMPRAKPRVLIHHSLKPRVLTVVRAHLVLN